MKAKRHNKNGGMAVLLDVENIKIVNVKDPKPGLWNLRVASQGPHTVRVTGLR